MLGFESFGARCRSFRVSYHAATRGRRTARARSSWQSAPMIEIIGALTSPKWRAPREGPTASGHESYGSSAGFRAPSVPPRWPRLRRSLSRAECACRPGALVGCGARLRGSHPRQWPCRSARARTPRRRWLGTRCSHLARSTRGSRRARGCGAAIPYTTREREGPLTWRPDEDVMARSDQRPRRFNSILVGASSRSRCGLCGKSPHRASAVRSSSVTSRAAFTTPRVDRRGIDAMKSKSRAASEGHAIRDECSVSTATCGLR